MDGTPNLLSTFVFFLWVPFCLWGMRRWPGPKGTAFLFFGGMLLLPEVVTFTLPGLPPFHKYSILLIWILIGIVAFHRERFSTANFSWHFKWCVGFLVVGAIITVLLNNDPLTYGSSYIPGHRPYDAVHVIVRNLFVTIIPFVVGLLMFQNGTELRTLLQVYVGAALLYSLLQITEMAVSPQLHRWVYGFHQHSFAQTMRGGGFRPMVFLGHGLALAMFTSMAVVAAAALQRVSTKVLKVPAAAAGGYLWLVLVASRSVAAVLYNAAVVPLVLFFSPKTQVLVAAVLASILFAYPAARAVDLIPIDQINEFVLEQYGVDKVGSLTVRFENEAAMLEKDVERLWFGWGKFCRACLYDHWSGDLISIRDGAWITTFGDAGLVGFVGQFGMLAFPIFVLARRLNLVPLDRDRRLLAAVALIVGISTFDLIPNGNFNPLAMVLSGAMYGTYSGAVREATLARRRRRLVRLQAARQAREAPA